MPSLSQNISIGIWVCSVYGCVRVCMEEGVKAPFHGMWVFKGLPSKACVHSLLETPEGNK